jgi:hypothetical protein
MKKLKGNLGRLDKYIRLGIAIVFLFLYHQLQAEIFLVIAVVILSTVVMNWCPIYYLARAIIFSAKNID